VGLRTTKRAGAKKTYKGFPDPSRVVSVDEASALSADGQTVFVDTRNYWKYAEGHIPGAVNLELYAFHWVDTSKEGLEVFAAQMSRLLGAYGIDEMKPVVFYADDSGYDAARGVWLLEFLGSRRGRMLDGGLRAWKRSGLATSTADAHPVRKKFTPRIDLDVVCGVDEVMKDVGRDSVTILDVRSAGEFTGKYTRALKGGHVPGAVNIEWKSALRRDGTLKDAEQLSAIYGSIPRGEVVTYCQSGYRAAHSWLVLKLLGFEHACNYLGSWYEWGNHPSTRVEG
jgi:thiosulfate/3-mercaptopyruvate sulfurtransferase